MDCPKGGSRFREARIARRQETLGNEAVDVVSNAGHRRRRFGPLERTDPPSPVITGRDESDLPAHQTARRPLDA